MNLLTSLALLFHIDISSPKQSILSSGYVVAEQSPGAVVSQVTCDTCRDSGVMTPHYLMSVVLFAPASFIAFLLFP